MFGPQAYFFSLAGTLSSLMLYAIWRKARRAAVPDALKLPFINAQPQAVSGQMMAQVAHDAAAANAAALSEEGVR
jgi:hypothetical protein